MQQEQKRSVSNVDAISMLKPAVFRKLAVHCGTIAATHIANPESFPFTAKQTMMSRDGFVIDRHPGVRYPADQDFVLVDFKDTAPQGTRNRQKFRPVDHPEGVS